MSASSHLDPPVRVWQCNNLHQFQRAGSHCRVINKFAWHGAASRRERAGHGRGVPNSACLSALAKAIAIDIIADLHSNKYSREIETSADITGSDICAAAGYNPYGLIWLFEDFKDANLGEGPEILSDHPGNDARIHALQDHFSEQPSVFSKFNSDRKGARPFRVPEEAPVIFLRIAPRAEARK